MKNPRVALIKIWNYSERDFVKDESPLKTLTQHSNKLQRFIQPNLDCHRV